MIKNDTQVPITQVYSSIPLEQHVIIVLILVLSLFFGNNLFSSHIAQAADYIPAATLSCSHSGQLHCYGIQDWPGDAKGAQTNMTVVPLACNPSACWQGTSYKYSYFVTNELWLIDTKTEGPNCNMKQCWVEVGEGTYTFSSTDTIDAFFWADNRYNKGGYHEYYNQVSSSEFGAPYNLYLDYVNNTKNQEWYAEISNSQYGVGIFGDSKNNLMYPDIIWMGVEIYAQTDESNISSPGNDYVFNQYADHNTNIFRYQNNDGTANGGGIYDNNSAITTYWIKPPSSTYSGNLFTYCGC